MRVCVPRESGPGEHRVALVPETVAKLGANGFEVVVERGAGVLAGFPDERYSDAGAQLADFPGALDGVEGVLRVGSPNADEVGAYRRGLVLVGFLQPLTDLDGISRLRERGVVAFAMESIPRITRAQSMDALSSQATVAGYKAVLLAADRSPKLFPMMMTAAGTIAPARVLVLGAGVAGLQAIATARRLGAVVSAFDVRPAVAEQVESLGASFLDLGIRGEETEGGYARELTEEQQRAQQAALEERIPEFDVVVTTAAVPGRPAPRLIPAVGGRVDASRVGDRRPGGGDGRQLRADVAGPRDRAHGRHDRRPHERPVADARRREPALLAERRGAARAPRPGRHAHARLRGRDHRRRLRHRRAGRGGCMTDLGLVVELTILVLSIFLGFEVISKVPTMLHTPLMSGTNFIHGIVIVGAIIVLGYADDGVTKAIGFTAMVLATANVVGGWFVTDRMLEMFKRRPDPRKDD